MMLSKNGDRVMLAAFIAAVIMLAIAIFSVFPAKASGARQVPKGSFYMGTLGGVGGCNLFAVQDGNRRIYVVVGDSGNTPCAVTG